MNHKPRKIDLLLAFRNVTIVLGGESLLSNVDLAVHAGEKIALVGRNGSGKSTLLKLMYALMEPDGGDRFCIPGLRIGCLEQDPDFSSYSTIGEFARADLTSEQHYLVDIAMEGMPFDPDIPTQIASGGEKRRAALARMFAQQHDLLLIDEPTNHLDLSSITWLEERLESMNTAFVLISHDRELLRQVSTRTFWIDRGAVRIRAKGFSDFDDWQENFHKEELTQRHKLDRKIRVETIWLNQGVSARRKRNQGRLRNLEALRQERAGLRRMLGSSDFQIANPAVASQMVIEANHVCLRFGKLPIVEDFTTRILKGDRVAIIGPNGVGKSTLLKLLTKELNPDKGKIRLGYNVELASMWQDRHMKNSKLTVQEYLVGKGANARDRPDHVIYQGRSRHVKSYLKQYQFEHWHTESPLKSLSGGELGRLCLAKVMLQESNVMVLDEPTNDLDTDTLEMLQEALADYKGTVLFVSHDRAFLDNVATMTIMLEGNGKWNLFPGGWSVCKSQWIQSMQNWTIQSNSHHQRNRPLSSNHQIMDKSIGLSFSEKHRLLELEPLINEMTQSIRDLETCLNEPNLANTDMSRFNQITIELTNMMDRLRQLEDEWFELEERNENTRLLSSIRL